jgi:hypothetical protein
LGDPSRIEKQRNSPPSCRACSHILLGAPWTTGPECTGKQYLARLPLTLAETQYIIMILPSATTKR